MEGQELSIATRQPVDGQEFMGWLKQAEEGIRADSTGCLNDSIFGERFGLTRREVEVLGWVTDGKTNAEIGLILSLSPRTVQKHLEHVFGKLGVETRTAAAVRALTLTSAQEPPIIPLRQVAA